MHYPTKNGMSQIVMQKFKRRLFLHETTSFDLLNLTLSYDKINGYFISCKQTKVSNIKNRKNMSKSFCNLRDAVENCPNLCSGFFYCRPNCANKIVIYALYMDNI